MVLLLLINQTAFEFGYVIISMKLDHISEAVVSLKAFKPTFVSSCFILEHRADSDTVCGKPEVDVALYIYMKLHMWCCTPCHCPPKGADRGSEVKSWRRQLKELF